MGLMDSIFGAPYSDADGYADSPRQGGLLGNDGWMSNPRNAQALMMFGDALVKAGAPSRYKQGWAGALGQGLSAMNQGGMQYDQQQFQKQMQDLQMQQLKQSLNQKVDPRQFLGKVDVDKVTPDSIQKFLAGGGDYGQLQPVAPKRDVRDVNGQLVEIPQTGAPAPIYGQPKLPDILQYGPDGKPQINPLMVDAKSQIAKAGASNISVNTEKSLLNTVAGGIGKSIETSKGNAEGAIGTLNTLDRLDSALASDKILAGPGTKGRLFLAQVGNVLGTAGKDSNETMVNTRKAIQALAQLELDAAQQMKGQGQITEAERSIIRRASAGDIDEMTKPELQLLSGALRKTAQFKITTHNNNVEPLLGNKNAAPLAPFLKVNPPSTGFKYLGTE